MKNPTTEVVRRRSKAVMGRALSAAKLWSTRAGLSGAHFHIAARIGRHRVLRSNQAPKAPTPKASSDGVVSSKSPFRGLPEVEIQQTIANSKAESAGNPISKEFASEDTSIARYGDFRPDRSAVGRLRRRAFGVKIINLLKSKIFMKII